MTTIEDTCQCGAVLSLIGPDVRLITDQHDMWLEHHEPCQEWHDHWWERLRLMVGRARSGLIEGDHRG